MLKPKFGECLQDWLSRALAGGMTMSEASAVWNKTYGLAANEKGVVALAGPATITLAEGEDGGEEKPSRFEILANTGKIIDFGWYRFVIQLSGVRANSKFPALLQHRVDQIVGTADEYSADDNGLYVKGAFSKVTSFAEQVLGLAREGFPWQASIQIRAKVIRELAAGETYKVNGRTVEGPLEIWTESEMGEVSFVAFGADPDTAAVAMGARPGTNNHQTEESIMNILKLARRLLKLAADSTDAEVLKTLGLAQGATDDQVEAALEMKLADKAKTAQPGQAAQLAGDAVAKAVKDAMVQLAAEQAEARKTITQLCDTYKCGDLKTALLSEGVSVETARERIMAHLSSGNRPLGGIISMGATDTAKLHKAIVDGLSLQSGVKLEKPADGYEEFRGMTLSGLAAFILSRQGVNVFSMSKSQIADKVFSLSGIGGTSVSDFASIFRDVAGKKLQAAYMEAPATWRPWVNVIPAPDFKTIYGVSLSEAPSLELIGENGEYRTGNFKDRQETYSVATYGKIVRLTRQMIVNDDLRAFTRIPQLFGAAARRKEADIVYNLLLANPTMSDNVALFHADHGNLEAASKGEIDSDKLSLARAAMRKQKGINGSLIDVQPRFVLVPVAQETKAEILIRSVTLPVANQPAGTMNPWQNLTPIAEPRLDANSTKAWYLTGDPNQVDTIEVAYLDGNEQPYMAEHEEFSTDAIGMKVRHDIGAGVMDHVGFYKNPGQ